jgi:DNA-binding MarR family transcriptional regulator
MSIPSPDADRTEAPRLEALATGLHSVAIHLLRRVRESDATLGVSLSRLSALSVVVFGGPCSLGELAAAEQVTPPTMSRLVDALTATGLVTRRPAEDDRRAVVIEATDQGRALIYEGRRMRVERLTSQLRGLSPDDLAALEEAVDVLRRLEG